MQPNRPEVPIVDSNNIYEVDFQGLKELSKGVTMKICAAVINTDGEGRRVIVALSSEFSRHEDSLGRGLLLAGLNGFTDKRVVSVGGGQIMRDPSTGTLIIVGSSTSLRASIPEALRPQIIAAIQKKLDAP